MAAKDGKTVRVTLDEQQLTIVLAGLAMLREKLSEAPPLTDRQYASFEVATRLVARLRRVS